VSKDESFSLVLFMALVPLLRLKKLARQLIVNHVKRHKRAELRMLRILREAFGSKFIMLDYEVQVRPRYTPGRPHPLLFELINANRKQYESLLSSFLKYKDDFVRISHDAAIGAPDAPRWRNEFLAGLDAVALYSMLAATNPRRYLEIGSGNSTEFARRAIRDHGLRTQITSLDPNPRSGVDTICDLCVRVRLEDSDLDVFQTLEEGDILFVDGSHRSFTNSDVTVFFLEVLPHLKPGVLVQIHDIHLPYDYPEEWSHRFYSEQYLLATTLLSQTNYLTILLPNAFISHDERLARVVEPLWNHPSMKDVDRYGGSFWIMKGPNVRTD